MRVSAGLRVSLNQGERGGGSSSESMASGFQYFSHPGWRRLGRVPAPVHMLLRVETSDADSDRFGLTQRVMSMPARAADSTGMVGGPARAEQWPSAGTEIPAVPAWIMSHAVDAGVT